MRVKFFTFGCKVNQYETQSLIEEFENRGCVLSDELTDLYVINTCSVTSRADKKSREFILRAKRQNPLAKIAVCGCWPELNEEAVRKIGVDYIISQAQKHNLVDIILGSQTNRKNIWSLKISRFFNHRAFVKIQDGCDNFCSFCKVPHIRGRSVSRPVQEIIAEVERICANYKEIVLCGINIGLYGKDLKGTYDLADLVAEILAIKSLGRLRLSSLEPRTVNDKLIELFHHEKLCPHVHFPFQSGDNTILKRMNKKDTIESYREIASRFRKIHSDIALGCDIIISFPGEAEANFQNTFRFLEELRPMRIHIFPFSPRENTPLSKIKPDAYLARKRSAILKELAQRFSLEYRSSFLGKTLAMITEEQKNDYVFGYTQNYIKVQTSAAAKLGEILPVKVVKIEEEKTFAVLA